jgi:hypothetical protein
MTGRRMKNKLTKDKFLLDLIFPPSIEEEGAVSIGAVSIGSIVYHIASQKALYVVRTDVGWADDIPTCMETLHNGLGTDRNGDKVGGWPGKRQMLNRGIREEDL